VTPVKRGKKQITQSDIGEGEEESPTKVSMSGSYQVRAFQRADQFAETQSTPAIRQYRKSTDWGKEPSWEHGLWRWREARGGIRPRRLTLPGPS
jgi:hypothetical protein